MSDEKFNENPGKEGELPKNTRDYFAYLDNISRALSAKQDELDNENKYLKIELTRLKRELEENSVEGIEYKKQIDILSRQLNEAEDKLIEINEKYEKESKKAKFLEIENARNMDELKNLRKENKLLSSKTIVEKKTFRGKIIKFLSR